MQPPHFQFDLLGVPWGDDAGPLVKTLQAMVAGIAGSKEKQQSAEAESRSRTLEERLDAFSKPLPESKR